MHLIKKSDFGVELPGNKFVLKPWMGGLIGLSAGLDLGAEQSKHILKVKGDKEEHPIKTVYGWTLGLGAVGAGLGSVLFPLVPRKLGTLAKAASFDPKPLIDKAINTSLRHHGLMSGMVFGIPMGYALGSMAGVLVPSKDKHKVTNIGSKVGVVVGFPTAYLLGKKLSKPMVEKQFVDFKI